MANSRRILFLGFIGDEDGTLSGGDFLLCSLGMSKTRSGLVVAFCFTHVKIVLSAVII